VKLTTHLRLVQRSKNGWSCTSTPQYAQLGGVQGQLDFRLFRQGYVTLTPPGGGYCKVRTFWYQLFTEQLKGPSIRRWDAAHISGPCWDCPCHILALTVARVRKLRTCPQRGPSWWINKTGRWTFTELWVRILAVSEHSMNTQPRNCLMSSIKWVWQPAIDGEPTVIDNVARVADNGAQRAREIDNGDQVNGMKG
jgi:hypothetical protein